MKNEIKTVNAPMPVGPYSQAVAIRNMLFVSGQIPMKDGKLVKGDMERQTRQVMENLRAILKAAEFGFEDVVKTTIYLTDLSAYDIVNKAYGSYLFAPFPARETLCVKKLPANAKIEISMIAVKLKT